MTTPKIDISNLPAPPSGTWDDWEILINRRTQRGDYYLWVPQQTWLREDCADTVWQVILRPVLKPKPCPFHTDAKQEVVQLFDDEWHVQCSASGCYVGKTCHTSDEAIRAQHILLGGNQ